MSNARQARTFLNTRNAASTPKSIITIPMTMESVGQAPRHIKA